jgi:serine/threonine-protein kinase
MQSGGNPIPSRPEKLGPYRLDAEVGRGGMGVVYRATHSETGQAVAIKVLPAELARDGGFADRFAREISSLQKLSHPNIVKLIEPGEDQGYQYYVMEFVQGRPLDKVIAADRRLPWQRAVELAIQICHGLKHAHDHGIIHRDLKPANLLITDDDTVKLTDFGIAKVFAGTAITATGGIIGTPEYMSPEQGDSRPITRRSDLYSLGVVLYAMLTGRAPFLGRSMAELLNLHRYGQFDRPMAIVPEIPSWLDELVCQLLEKDPEKRPPDTSSRGGSKLSKRRWRCDRPKRLSKATPPSRQPMCRLGESAAPARQPSCSGSCAHNSRNSTTRAGSGRYFKRRGCWSSCSCSPLGHSPCSRSRAARAAAGTRSKNSPIPATSATSAFCSTACKITCVATKTAGTPPRPAR